MQKRNRSTAEKVLRMGARFAGRVLPFVDNLSWRLNEAESECRQRLAAIECDLVLGNDTNTLRPVALHHQATGIPFIMDYHEFAPLEASQKPVHHWITGPFHHRLLKRFARLAAANVTVNRTFVDRFRADYGIEACTVRNAPELRELPPARPRTDDRIHLVFHGFPGPDRNVDTLLRAMAMTRDHVQLHLMLKSGTEEGGLIRTLAAACPPGRVVFEESVPIAEVLPKLVEWDVGFNILTPCNYNNRHALPNKLFDYIHAGMACIFSDTESAHELIAEADFGWIAPGQQVTPEGLAEIINRLTPEEIERKKAIARELRLKVHAEAEEQNLTATVARVFGQKAAQ
jgi:glycosyltransferase involved in cell wall biosynthesis